MSTKTSFIVLYPSNQLFLRQFYDLISYWRIWIFFRILRGILFKSECQISPILIELNSNENFLSVFCLKFFGLDFVSPDKVHNGYFTKLFSKFFKIKNEISWVSSAILFLDDSLNVFKVVQIRVVTSESKFMGMRISDVKQQFVLMDK